MIQLSFLKRHTRELARIRVPDLMVNPRDGAIRGAVVRFMVRDLGAKEAREVFGGDARGGEDLVDVFKSNRRLLWVEASIGYGYTVEAGRAGAIHWDLSWR